MNKPFTDKQVARLKAIADKLNDLSLEIENLASLPFTPIEKPTATDDILIEQSFTILSEAGRASGNAVDSLEELLYNILPKFK